MLRRQDRQAPAPAPIAAPGRRCPLSYRYGAEELNRPPAFRAETVYVIGGLYGNPEALDTILAMAAGEKGDVRLIFNGDFNWFNAEPDDMRLINEAVLAHTAIRGNVESEMTAREDGAADCGCNYPPYVSDETVTRSNEIMARLRVTARLFPELSRRLAALPRFMTVAVGSARVGILHGDPESLAGWSFAVEALAPADRELRARLGCSALALTPATTVARWFRAAKVRVFACTHTCLPFAQDFMVDGALHLVINNGSAGMSNFAGSGYGVMTRISANPEPPSASLYGIRLEGGLRCDALAVVFSSRRWLARFLCRWPAGSAAYVSYFERLTNGPPFHLQQAARRRVALTR